LDKQIICPECGSRKLTRVPKMDLGKADHYRCEKGHGFWIDRSQNPKPYPVHIPFKEAEFCPECGSRELRKVHDQKYPEKKGVYRLVVYRCHRGHETKTRQLIVKDPDRKQELEVWA
jgi:predicted  nucleic acid-binding Zn-ribbon protein